MKNIILSVILITGLSYSQTVYEVEPGTKENEITITLSNISKIENAENIVVDLFKSPSSLIFKNEKQSIEKIEVNKEADVTFSFDVNYAASAEKRDTIEFMISSDNGISMKKSFVIKYTSPKEFALEQNYPNPFNPTTKIRFTIPIVRDENLRPIQLKVYDILGNEIATLVNKEQPAGYYEVDFNGNNFASGVYIYRLIADPESSSGHGFVSTKKMILIR